MSHMLSNTTITRKERLHQLKEREHGYFDLQFIKAMPPEHRNGCIELLDRSHGQLRQDLFVLAQANFKRGGYFVEFGATDGVNLNNSWLLETEFDWTGILVEPGRVWHDALKRNRHCIIDTRCVWSASGERLQLTDHPQDASGSIASFVKPSRKLRGNSYEVETVSLGDLLEQHEAPPEIDYLSIDTGRSPFDILDAVDFERWSFRIITLEHNHSAQREDIFELLTGKGYSRVHEAVSRFEDWYIGQI